jgi:FkbM family methyltransferase
LSTPASPLSGGAQALARSFDVIAKAGSAAALRQRLRERWPAFIAPKELAIVGAADEGVRLASLCGKLGIALRAVADDNPKMIGRAVAGVPVSAVDELRKLGPDVPVIVASHRALKPVRRLRGMGFRHVAPFLLLQAMEPERFPPHMFHVRLLEELVSGLPRLRALEGRLADDQSKAVLAAVIDYRLSGEPESLDPVVQWELYGPGTLLTYGSDEVYVDGGTFDGDSIRLFSERVGNRYERIIGFEPDPGTFKRLQANFAGEPRVEPVNAGLHSKKGTLRFDDAGTRGSILVESGGVEVPVVPLDEVLKGARVSYIKMNIEGVEVDALEGARASITRWAPKLAISAYHHANDLWRIPEAILSLRPDYRVYFRQHDGGIIETVTYALPASSA